MTLKILLMIKPRSLMADTPDNFPVIQRGVNRVEKWANRNLMKFNKGSEKSCACTVQGRCQQAGKNLVSNRPEYEADQQCAFDTKVSSLLGHSRSVTSRSREVIPPLYVAQVRHIWSAVSSAELLSTSKTCSSKSNEWTER